MNDDDNSPLSQKKFVPRYIGDAKPKFGVIQPPASMGLCLTSIWSICVTRDYHLSPLIRA